MDTPKRMNATETLAQISAYYARHCHLNAAGKLTCDRCGGEIHGVRAYMSLHDHLHGNSCVGPARAWRMEIPYCPACESIPSEYGCIHMSGADLNLPSVLEASRPFGPECAEYKNRAPSKL